MVMPTASRTRTSSTSSTIMIKSFVRFHRCCVFGNNLYDTRALTVVRVRFQLHQTHRTSIATVPVEQPRLAKPPPTASAT